MSSSAGILLTPLDALQIYQPEVFIWTYGRVAPMKAFDVAVDDQVLRTYDEFDRALEGKPQVETDVRSLELSRIPGRDVAPVPFRQLAGFTGIAQGDPAALERVFASMGVPYTRDQFEERLEKAENWLELYVPDQRIVLRGERNIEYYEALAAEDRANVRALFELLTSSGPLTVEEATERVYEIPKRPGLDDKAQGALQRRFFQVVYNLLFGKDRGPRLGTFLAAVDRDQFVGLLDFPE